MTQERPQIERLELAGFKSIREAAIDFTRLNVLIGSNGAGKSNLVSFFAMLRASLDDRLDAYVESNGGPNALLQLGTKQTKVISTRLTVRATSGRGVLHQRLGFVPPDRLNYGPPHTVTSNVVDHPGDWELYRVCSVAKLDGTEHPGWPIFVSLKNRVATYHLADTSLASAIRVEGYIQDDQRLNPDGGNLAAILYLYKSTHPSIYDRIRSAIRKVVPYFDDFALEPKRFNANNILLNWRQTGSDYLLGPHQISDGTIRAMALITLLLQPTADLPDVLIIDEPELGLHPMAMTMIAGLIRAASVHCQVIVTTQSPTFLDHFEADEIIVVDSDASGSQFRRLDLAGLTDWLAEYSVGELWQKNVIGGGPMP